MKKLTVTKETLSVLTASQTEQVNGGIVSSGLPVCNNSVNCSKNCGISLRGNCM